MQASFVLGGDAEFDISNSALHRISHEIQIPYSVCRRGPKQFQINLPNSSQSSMELLFRYFDLEISTPIKRILSVLNETTELKIGGLTLPAGTPIKNEKPSQKSLIHKAIHLNTRHLKQVLSTPNADFKGNGRNLFGIKRIAKRHGFGFSRIRRSAPFAAIFSTDRGPFGLEVTRCNLVQPSAIEASADKSVTKRIANAKGITTPPSHRMTTLGQAMRRFYEADWEAAVLKPVFGSHGDGVTVEIKELDELLVAWRSITKNNTITSGCLLEEFIPSVDLRILVFGGNAKVAMMRLPANVVGDGQSSIAGLISEKNLQRNANPRLKKSPIELDASSCAFLSAQGLYPESVPEPGELVLLRGTANLSTGGDSVILTDHIHPDILAFAENSAKSMGSALFCGVDLFVRDITQGNIPRNIYLGEVNTRAEYGGPLFPMYGDRFDTRQALISAIDDALSHQEPSTNQNMNLFAGLAGPLAGPIGSPDMSWRKAFEHIGYNTEEYAGGFVISNANRRGFVSNKINDNFAEVILRIDQRPELQRYLATFGVELRSRTIKTSHFEAAQAFLEASPNGLEVTQKKRIARAHNQEKLRYIFEKWGTPLTLTAMTRNQVISVDVIYGQPTDQHLPRTILNRIQEFTSVLTPITAIRIWLEDTQNGCEIVDVAVLNPKDIQDPNILIFLAKSIVANDAVLWF